MRGNTSHCMAMICGDSVRGHCTLTVAEEVGWVPLGVGRRILAIIHRDIERRIRGICGHVRLNASGTSTGYGDGILHHGTARHTTPQTITHATYLTTYRHHPTPPQRSAAQYSMPDQTRPDQTRLDHARITPPHPSCVAWHAVSSRGVGHILAGMGWECKECG